MRLATPVLALSFAFVVAGCGGKKGPEKPPVTGVKVSGKLVQGGSPVKHLKDETIKVSFLSEAGLGGDKVLAQGEVDKSSGAFSIIGPDGQGIPAGKYKVLVGSELYGDNNDRFNEKFDAGASPLVADVTAEEGQVFTVDIGSRKVTKGK
jgi:hypothetical protein